MRKSREIKQLRHFAVGFEGYHGYGRAVAIDFLVDPQRMEAAQALATIFSRAAFSLAKSSPA